MPRQNKVAIITFVPPSSVMRKEVGIRFRATPRLSADSAGILRFEEEATPPDVAWLASRAGLSSSRSFTARHVPTPAGDLITIANNWPEALGYEVH